MKETIHKLKKLKNEIKEEKQVTRMLPDEIPMCQMSKRRIKQLKKEKMNIIRGVIFK